jgi:hypothetical protein
MTVRYVNGIARLARLRSTIGLAIAVLVCGCHGTTRARAQQPSEPSAKPAPAAGSAPAVVSDVGWPRVYTDGTSTIAVHQPQIESWADFKFLKARSAIEILPGQGIEKLLAAVSWEAQSDVDLETRMVVLNNIHFTSFRIPSQNEDTTKMIETAVSRLFPNKTDAVALDRVLAYMESTEANRETRVSTEAPSIVVSVVPAILVMIDGQPVFGKVPGLDKLRYIINTNWDCFQEDDDGDFYLLNVNQWLTAEELDGPWKAAGKLPKQLNELPADENWADVRQALPLKKKNRKSAAPVVYVFYRPAEMILINGTAKFQPVLGTQLSEVTNTTSLLLYHSVDKNYYFLTAGRWFRSDKLRGIWEFASDKLPADFQQFPTDHPKAHLRTSIPGTIEAKDAVLLATVPQLALVNRKEAAAQVKVTYVGTPQFTSIEGTSTSYAVNTPADVISVDDRFYLLQQGVWFVAASADGPWEVADQVPQQIYSIPPESPKHHTTYVYVSESDDDSVTVAQTAGYMGMAIGMGVVMWGTGYYYPPYYYWGPMYPYPIYWGYPYYSYGAAAWYNPATGFYGRGGVAYGPYGGYGRAAAYNPVTGSYVRRAGAWGPYQGAMGTSFYNARTGTWGAGYRYANPYQGWGQGVVRRGDQWARGGYYYDERGAIGGIRTSDGGKLIAAGDGDNRGMIGRTSDGDLYVGKDGNVYRRDESGKWQQRGDGGWDNIDPGSLSADQRQRLNDARSRNPQARPQGTDSSRARAQSPGPRPSSSERQPARPDRDVVDGLNRDAGARSRGNQNYGRYSRPSGGYGGMRRGGGRRR